MTKNFLAVDYGGSSGRGILGSFDGEILSLKEVHRFENYFVKQNGVYFWDVYRLFHELQNAVKKAGSECGRRGLTALGIDTWGTDYGLLDHNGQLLGNVRCMRNADGRAVKKVTEIVGEKELFYRTGIQTIPGNTLFQLYERLERRDPALLHAEKMLMLPDLLGYFLTGSQMEEYTMATTSMCYDPQSKTWDYGLLNKLGIPEKIFAPVVYPGEYRIPVIGELQEDMGVEGLQYIVTGTHDTASAVAAIPLEEQELFCSSGTWSLFGMESDIVWNTEAVRVENFSNEGTIDGKIRLLKNIMGMWLIQECAREWRDQGICLSWEQIVKEASKVPAFESLVDTELPELYNAGRMVGKIQDYCRRTKQKVPESTGEIARCIYQSIALRYRVTMEQLMKITGKNFRALRIVGGGCKNDLLNQFAANALGIPVYCGPAEGACVGNILTQCIAEREAADIKELREIVKRSFEVKCFLPREESLWQEGYEKYCGLIGRKQAMQQTKRERDRKNYENADRETIL